MVRYLRTSIASLFVGLTRKFLERVDAGEIAVEVE